MYKSLAGLILIVLLTGIFLFIYHRNHTALAHAVRIKIDSRIIPTFQIDKNDRTRFGDLRYSSGIEYWSENESLGGISGFRILDGGRNFLSVSDHGNWFTGSIARDETGKIIGIRDAKIAPLRNKKGNPITTKSSGDAEGLEIVGDRVLVSFERKSRILNYKLDLDHLASRAKDFRPSIKKVKLPYNSGLEAITKLEPLDNSRLSKIDIAVFSESSLDANGNIQGFISKKKKWHEFTVRENGGYKITDTTLLSDGNILILERQYSLITGVQIRIRKIPVSDIEPGALLDGEIIFEADARFQIDNFEGMSVWVNEENKTMLTIASDDNFSPLQRNLLLEFELLSEKTGD
ncbi:MAG: hypothetical protein GY742_12095 [Hyphomicrobiales bacterium]|nr:hypothetical protein [Hyphomicrobiales bacterium]